MDIITELTDKLKADILILNPLLYKLLKCSTQHKIRNVKGYFQDCQLLRLIKWND